MLDWVVFVWVVFVGVLGHLVCCSPDMWLLWTGVLVGVLVGWQGCSVGGCEVE